MDKHAQSQTDTPDGHEASLWIQGDPVLAYNWTFTDSLKPQPPAMLVYFPSQLAHTNSTLGKNSSYLWTNTGLFL